MHNKLCNILIVVKTRRIVLPLCKCKLMNNKMKNDIIVKVIANNTYLIIYFIYRKLSQYKYINEQILLVFPKLNNILYNNETANS